MLEALVAFLALPGVVAFAAPWARLQHLVGSGPYRFSRNPMDIAVSLILAGWAVLYWSYTLMIYLIVVGIAFQLRAGMGVVPGADEKAVAVGVRTG